MITEIFMLLVIFEIKHDLADFEWQNAYMLQKFKADWGFFKPLAVHCAVHAFCTFFIVWAWYWHTPNMPILSILAIPALDFITHFVMDRIKAGPKYLGRFKTINEFEYNYHQQEINRAVKEGAIYNCHKAENLFYSRMRSNNCFWSSLGFDQGFHHIIHYLIIYLLMTWRV